MAALATLIKVSSIRIRIGTGSVDTTFPCGMAAVVIVCFIEAIFTLLAWLPDDGNWFFS